MTSIFVSILCLTLQYYCFLVNRYFIKINEWKIIVLCLWGSERYYIVTYLVCMTHRWNNLLLLVIERLENQIIQKSLKVSKPKGINRIAIIGWGYLYLYLREIDQSFILHYLGSVNFKQIYLIDLVSG
jgi:hypothetical protein